MSSKDIDSGPLLKLGFGLLKKLGHLYPELQMRELMIKLLETKDNDLVDELIGDPKTKESLRQLIDVIPTLNDDTSHITTGIAIIAVLMFLSTATVALRFYSRKVKTHDLRIEDWLSLVALASVIFDGACTTVLQSASVHAWQFSMNHLIMWNKVLYALMQIFCFAHFFVKLTYLMFYYSLSPKRSYRWMIMAIGGFLLAFSVAGHFVFAFQCTPIDYWYHLGTAKCIDSFQALLAFGVVYIIADFMILFIPVSTVLGLQLRLREKLVVLGIFGTMAFVCIASIQRLLSLTIWFRDPDFTYKRIDHGIWANVELNLALIISCMPALKALIFPSARFKKNSTRSNTTGIKEGTLNNEEALRITRRYDISLESVAENGASTQSSVNGTCSSDVERILVVNNFKA